MRDFTEGYGKGVGFHYGDGSINYSKGSGDRYNFKGNMNYIPHENINLLYQYILIQYWKKL